MLTCHLLVQLLNQQVSQDHVIKGIQAVNRLLKYNNLQIVIAAMKNKVI